MPVSSCHMPVMLFEKKYTNAKMSQACGPDCISAQPRSDDALDKSACQNVGASSSISFGHPVSP